jgi:hypothetical protein
MRSTSGSSSTRAPFAIAIAGGPTSTRAPFTIASAIAAGFRFELVELGRLRLFFFLVKRVFLAPVTSRGFFLCASYRLQNLRASSNIPPMKITDEMRKQIRSELARAGGKARAKKYDKKTLSKWAKKGGRPRKDGAR